MSRRGIVAGGVGVVMACAVAVAQGPAGTQVMTGLGAKLDQYLSRLEKFGFSGGVIAAKDGQVILEKGYGLADRARKTPFTPDTVASVGSITKQFTAAAILKLESQGRLKVTDPISRHLPNVPAAKQAITIHHLLTHTGGLRGDYGGRDADPIPRDELVELVLQTPLAQPPGAGYEYSNEGYSLLGAIIERASGRSYEEFLRAELFLPAGMKDTGYVLPGWDPERVALGYAAGGRDWGRITEKGWGSDGPGWYLKANGGIHTTLGDMWRWNQALDGDAVLPAAARAKLFKRYVREGPNADSYYAYGWAIFTTPRKTRLVAHNGGNGVFAADFRRYVDEHVFLYAHSNAEVSAIDLTNSLAGLVFGAEVAMPPEVIAQSPETLQRLAGVYLLPTGERITVSVNGDGLALASDGPTIFAVLNGLQPPGSERFRALEQRTVAVLTAAARGDYAPIHRALGDVPLERVTQNESAVWEMRRKRFGALQGVDPLGSGGGGGGASVHVRLRFERGTQVVQFIWDGEVLAGRQVLDVAPSALFLPVAATEFASFSLRRDQARLRFDTPDANAAPTLNIIAGGREVTVRAARQEGS